MLHRQFPELKISASLLRTTYLKHGIKYKQIKKGKKIIDYTDDHYRHLFDTMYSLL
jgi:hypothetical protein